MANGSDQPSRNDMMLFYASFATLIAAGIGFSVRGTSVLAQWGKQFGFTQLELGEITGVALAGFGIAIFVLSFVADKIGYGRLMALAFLLHVSSAIVTLSAGFVYQSYGKDGAYWCLSIGMWLFALGNGTCEAVINPLTATLFPKNKTHWLNILHAGWPAGMVLGALIGIVFEQIGNIPWEVQIGIFLIPTFVYGFLMLGKAFPKSEVTSSGVPFGQMLITLLSPILLFLFALHALVGYVELGTDSWITNITDKILENGTLAKILFIYTSTLMFVLRFCAGPIVHRISPLGLLFASSIIGATGLYLLSSANSITMCFLAATIYGVGKTFLWPTMLGVVSEQFPKGGALALGISGGIGMLSAGLLGGPGIGYKQDYFASTNLQQTSEASFERYATSQPKSFLPMLGLFPEIRGLDGRKVGILEDEAKTLTSDVEVARESNANPNVLKTLEAEETWWNTVAKPNIETDKAPITASNLFGARQALLYTALVPAAMAVGYLLLMLVFALKGGYKQQHI
ncbi:MFS transporter [Tuwongella immobilis]|uniref:Major facilitator superfamily (MFS) profile domain-containing protein n=1 Tax=Tuwongella immobilis TaxID=692036 RepID=A0A6C2YN71_9BACT|nr:MFS transporter [Tuwongella immobilis]VIP02886.1 mfs transporter : Uncharacterized protein OS=Planctomyces maris DSM 8797 GN=PM8797T_03449 PE=4 SV=1: MFS_1 [Tuwongella immobilis]VTS02746.1 mfs transporter : Uncharacterized protein OS=Planctomyces maris DSM 8797 GN=PM8797T_03449 PE=4 SV=1: MFS_1 [Tuwongella immobilis]